MGKAWYIRIQIIEFESQLSYQSRSFAEFVATLTLNCIKSEFSSVW